MRPHALVAITLILFGAAAVQTQEIKTEPNVLSYRDFLWQAGEKLHCYLTVERDRSTAGGESCFDSVQIASAPVDTIDGLIAKLRREIPGAKVFRDEKQKQLIRLVETSLLSKKDYPVMKTATLDFTGTSDDMLEALGKVVPGIGPALGGFNEDAWGATLSKVTVHAKNEQVRDILTDVNSPLDHFHPLLWVATTEKHDGKLVTGVQFVGPKTTGSP
jgi:hypothetical protein